MLKKGLCITLLLFTCVLACAQDRPEQILFKSYAVQFNFRDSFAGRLNGETDTARALRTIRDLEKWAEEKDDIPLKYGFAITRFKYLGAGNRMDEAAYENGTGALLRDIHYSKLPMCEAELLVAKAAHYWDENKYVPAFEYSIKAYSLYSQFSEKDFPAKADYTAGFGGMFYHFRDFNTAKKYHLEGVKASNYSRISMMNTLGLCYINLNVYDSAEYFFNEAYNLAASQKDTGWMGILSGNLGYLYYCAGNYSKALPLLDEEVKLYVEKGKGDNKNAATSLALISEIYLSEKNKEKALATAQDAYRIVKKENASLSYVIQKSIFPALAGAYAANGKMELAYHYLDSATVAKDSIAKSVNQLLLAGAQNIIDADKHLAEVQKYEHEQKIHVLIRNGLIIGILLLTTIGVLLIRYQRQIFLNTRKRLEAEKIHAETELKNAFGQLNIFTQSISEKNDLIEKFTAEISRMQQYVDPASRYETETLSQLQQSTILSDAQWADFQHLFEKTHKGFLKRLNHKMHGLSPIDTRFMLLCKLRLSVKEMSAIMGVSKEAVLQNLDRLRHKLNLHNENITLEDFADTI
jgi:hypothetical protein